MKITCFTVGPLECNCYIVADEAARECAVIDPGGDADLIIRQCESASLTPRFIINTHAHADHIGANAELKERFPDAKLCIGRADAAQLADPVRNLCAMIGLSGKMPAPDVLLEEGSTIEFGSCLLTVIETPGHTPGSVSLIAEDEGRAAVFCGDLIFAGGVGRTDFPGGSFSTLRRSIQEKILKLPEETLLLPGHGESTTVGREKRFGYPL